MNYMEQIPTEPLFSLGDVIVTPGATVALTEADEDLELFLEQYQYGYWGSLPEQDQAANARAVELGEGRILGRYKLWPNEVVYVTTAPDRSFTTVLTAREW